jgi:hypothetical protein
MVAVLVDGGASGAIHIVTSPFQVPFDLASILWGSPGVAYAIQFFIAVAESTATQASSLGFESVEAEVVALALIASSGFLSSLQEANKNAAAQMVMVIRFIKKILDEKGTTSSLFANAFFDGILNFVDKISR